jgi:hypothetical protein
MRIEVKLTERLQHWVQPIFHPEKNKVQVYVDEEQIKQIVGDHPEIEIKTY